MVMRTKEKRRDISRPQSDLFCVHRLLWKRLISKIGVPGQKLHGLTSNLLGGKTLYLPRFILDEYGDMGAEKGNHIEVILYWTEVEDWAILHFCWRQCALGELRTSS